MDWSQGRACQSCGMPMIDVQHHGTNADGSVSSDYCVYCYQQGSFTSPTLTKTEMVEIATRYWATQNRTSVDVARRQVAPIVAELKRWRSQP